MELTEVRINLCESRGGHGRESASSGGRLRAFCMLTFDRTFVVRDVKLIDGNDGLFLAMPSRKLCDHCAACGEKNHLRARYCNNCGRRLDEQRYQQQRNGNGHSRVKLHADIAHPINAGCRRQIEDRVFNAYSHELECSRLPGYVADNLDGEDIELYDGNRRGMIDAARGSFIRPGEQDRDGFDRPEAKQAAHAAQST